LPPGNRPFLVDPRGALRQHVTLAPLRQELDRDSIADTVARAAG
jgi:hypothetical protein